jgi:hypothetical protein
MAMQDDSRKPSDCEVEAHPAAKKSKYVPPEVVDYGSVAELTQNASAKSM